MTKEQLTEKVAEKLTEAYRVLTSGNSMELNTPGKRTITSRNPFQPSTRGIKNVTFEVD